MSHTHTPARSGGPDGAEQDETARRGDDEPSGGSDQRTSGITPRQRRRERADLRRAARGDAAARERLIRAYLPLARSVARRFGRDGSVPQEDLQQIAAIGLIKALDRFDPQRGVRFTSYAVPMIRGEVLRYIRDFTWTVRPPRDLQDRARRVARARKSMTMELGRKPTVEELADRLGCAAEDVKEALQAEQARTQCSLDAEFPVGSDLHPARLGVEDPGFAAAEAKLSLERRLSTLRERERVALWLRYVDDLTQAGIAERMGCSQVQVSRILRGALASLGDGSSTAAPGRGVGARHASRSTVRGRRGTDVLASSAASVL